MKKITPKQKIRIEILSRAINNKDLDLGAVINSLGADNVDELYESLLVEPGLHWDYESEFREGEYNTGLPSDCNRHYECREVATKLNDGTWVGWTYWYGGGKYGEPESIDWMSDAYFLDVKEEEKLVVVREFKKLQ